MASSARIIPFPTTAVVWSAELVEAIEMVGACRQQVADNVPGSLKYETGKIMLDWWEGEHSRLSHGVLAFNGVEYAYTMGKA